MRSLHLFGGTEQVAQLPAVLRSISCRSFRAFRAWSARSRSPERASRSFFCSFAKPDQGLEIGQELLLRARSALSSAIFRSEASAREVGLELAKHVLERVRRPRRSSRAPASSRSSGRCVPGLRVEGVLTGERVQAIQQRLLNLLVVGLDRAGDQVAQLGEIRVSSAFSWTKQDSRKSRASVKPNQERRSPSLLFHLGPRPRGLAAPWKRRASTCSPFAPRRLHADLVGSEIALGPIALPPRLEYERRACRAPSQGFAPLLLLVRGESEEGGDHGGREGGFPDSLDR